jgi:hypothetical protein
MAGWRRFGRQLVDMPPARWVRSDRGRDLGDSIDPDYRLFYVVVAAKSEHAGIVTRWKVRSKRQGNRLDKPRPDANIIVGVNRWGRG